MRRIVECVPNFSEGRRQDVLDSIVEAMLLPGVQLLGREMDSDHNRAVVTLAGEPEAISEAAFRGRARAAELIDLDAHHGAHPRMGATDVIPFVPVRNVSMDDCIALARMTGARIGSELGIPVYLYERAAARPERRDLAYVRRGEYETIRDEIATNPEREPDFGPKAVGKAGAVVVGARPFLIVYNINLDTANLDLAKEIARVVRERGGGLPAVKALGFPLKEKGIVQVSMNLTDYNVSGLLEAFKEVSAQAQKRHVQVLGSEIVGLVPVDALIQLARQALLLDEFEPQVFELKLADSNFQSKEAG